MFVTTKKYNADMASVKSQVGELRLILQAAVGAKSYERAIKKVDKLTDGKGLDSINLEYEEMSNPLLDANKLPPRAEYDERVATAIKLFQDRHPVSEVATKLMVAKKTARRYLRIAIVKRKVKKADFDELNQ